MMLVFSNLYFWGALVLVLVGGNIWLRLSGGKRLQFIFNAIVLLALTFATVLLSEVPGVHAHLFSVNQFSTFFIMLFTMALFLVNFIAYAYSRDYQNFALLASFALVGMYLVASAVSLISIFIGLELASIPTVFIVLLSRRESLEAATKFFIMASIAMALLSFAIVLVYGSSNSLALSQLQQNGFVAFALVLFIAALGFETSIFPFNVLLPDVYQGSAAYATAMLGGINKKVGFAAFLQVLVLLFFTSAIAFEIVAILSVLTMFYGNLVALVQDNLKRLLAYSSISQAGYILIGIAVHTTTSIEGSIFQIFAHIFLFIGAMSVIAWLESRNRNEINDLIGLYKENRLAAFALTAFLLAMIGIPLTSGFIGKFLIFLSAVQANLAWLALFGILNSVISVFYYIKVISAMYTNKLGAHRIQLDRYATTVIVVCLVITIVFGIYPQPIIQVANGAANYLVGL